MTCRELIDFLLDYLDGGLSPAVRATFDGHLAICPDCRTYVHNYQEAVRAGRAALVRCDEDIPESVPDELVRAIVDARLH